MWRAPDGSETQDPASAAIKIHVSKTDKFSGESVREHSGSDRAHLCPVWCIAALVKAYPERQTGGSEEYEPFFRWPNGTPVKR